MLPAIPRLSAARLAQERLPAADEDVHFPEALAEAVITGLTHVGATVLDPFAGYGTTLAVSERLGRRAVGIELLGERVALIRARLHDGAAVRQGDARHLADLDLPPVDLCLTSPPYMSLVDHLDNPLTGYATRDGHYPTYLGELTAVFVAVRALLRPGGCIAVNVADVVDGAVVTPLVADLRAALEPHLGPADEVALVWDRPPAGISGDTLLVYPT